MKTYLEFITELRSLLEDKSEHASYGHHWGILDLKGKKYDGWSTKGATIHADLGKRTNHRVDYAHEYPIEAGEQDSSFGSGNVPLKQKTLNIRTTGKYSLKAAIDYFDRIPMIGGRHVNWEHYDKGDAVPRYGHEGEKTSVLNRMKAYYEKTYGNKR